MALTDERRGEIAFIVLMDAVRREGMTLKPKEAKRDAINRAKKLGLKVSEVRDLTQIVLRNLFEETMMELDGLPTSGPVEIS